MNTRSTGSRKEAAAAEYIIEHGGRIRERNFRSRMGEIDIVAHDEGAICFVEVKYRRNSAAGHPAEAVGIKKQLTICRTADYYRMKHHLSENIPYRFDVISITGDEITWYKNAFQYIPCY
ncbi:MAG: YraN family protein [Lachnospiraceae bacterium]|nr:YraN family protein [Lachnospiraceae bacterium]